MKGRIKCGLLLVFFTIFGLSLNAYSDANALKSQVSNANISSVYFRDASAGVDYNSNLVAQTASPIYEFTVPKNNGMVRLGRLRLNLADTRNFSNSRKWSFMLVFRERSNYFNQLFSSPVCPVGRNAFVVDHCSITLVDSYDRIASMKGVPSPDSFPYYEISSVDFRYYVMEIDGHYDSNNDTALNYVELWGQFYFVENTMSLLDLELSMQFGFSQVSTYVDPDESSLLDEQNKKDEQDRNNLESQSSQTDSDAESSASDAESTGTTLLSAFTSFVNALTNASPSNCNLDMDLGNLDLGVVNLCQLSLPQPLPTIASIMLILFCVPLSISTARKVISLFRSFQ